MPSHLIQREHTNAIVAALEDGDLTVGRGIGNEKPDGSGAGLAPPCVIVYPMRGPLRTGTLDDWTAHAVLVYQLTCVGKTQEQAEWMRDACELLLDGFTVPDRSLDAARFISSGQVDRNDDTGDPIFSCLAEVRFTSSPA